MGRNTAARPGVVAAIVAFIARAAPRAGPETRTGEARLVGVSFEGRQGVIRRRIRPGTKLTLRPEPDNPHDPCAVIAYTRRPREVVGYLPRDVAASVHRDLAGDAVVTAVLGGTPAKPLRGVAVTFPVRLIATSGACTADLGMRAATSGM